MNREEILDIAKKLYHNHLTPELATDLLLRLFDVSGTLQPINQMSAKNSYRYHTMCARATLYPNKTIEEVITIIEDTLSKWDDTNINAIKENKQ